MVGRRNHRAPGPLTRLRPVPTIGNRLSNDSRSRPCRSRPATHDPRRAGQGGDTVPLKEAPLDAFHGDETFPIEWSSETERDLFWVFDDLHCPQPLSPMYEDIGGWWLTCDHMFRRFGHAVRVRLDRQEHQRLPVHGGDPRRGEGQGRDPGVRLRDRRDRPAAGRVPGRDRRVPGRHAPGVRRGVRRLVARPAGPRDAAQLRLPRGGAGEARRDEPGADGRAARGRHRHPRPPLEDPLDAQLRAVQRDARTSRRSRRSTARPIPRCWAGSRTRPATATGTRSRPCGS